MSHANLNRRSPSNRWGDVAGRQAPKLLTVLASEPCSFPFSFGGYRVELYPSRNPYCTAVFCSVPRNQFFSLSVRSITSRQPLISNRWGHAQPRSGSSLIHTGFAEPCSVSANPFLRATVVESRS